MNASQPTYKASRTFDARPGSHDLRVWWDNAGSVCLGTGYARGPIVAEIAAYTELDVAETDRLIATLQEARREAFGEPPLTAAVIEVIERGRTTDETTGGSILVPTELRINGHRVMTAGGGVKIHEMQIPPRDMAQITVTLPARRITVAAEGDVPAAPASRRQETGVTCPCGCPGPCTCPQGTGCCPCNKSIPVAGKHVVSAVPAANVRTPPRPDADG